MPKIKTLLEGGQQIYTKNATSQGLVFIQRRNGYRTRENLVIQSYQFNLFHFVLKPPIHSWPP